MKRANHHFLLFVLITLPQLSFAQDLADLEARLDSLAKDVPGLNEKVDFTLVDAPLYELIRAVAETHNLNVSLASLPSINITNNFTNVAVKDLMVFICREYNLQIRFVNNIFTFYREQKPVVKEPAVIYDEAQDRLTLNVRNESVGNLAREVTQHTGYNVIANQQVSAQMVNGFIRSLPFETALRNFAQINNLKLDQRDENVFIIESVLPQQQPEGRNYTARRANLRGDRHFDLKTYRIGTDAYISLNCSQTPVGDLVRTVCEQLDINYLFLAEPQGVMDCHMDSVRFGDFLNIAMEISNFGYTLSPSNVYLMGEVQRNGLNESRLYSFRNRSVEGVMDVIPPGLLQQVQIQAFNDLNALIVTGTDKTAEKMIHFLEQIDRPVPNVMIEVIVVEVRRGSSIQTGVKAFLSDSVPSTHGQIFGGVDVTVSSESFNKFLNNLDSRGIVNLGRVTPKFYATIQAMEENNNLNIRSTPKLSTLNGHEATLTIGQSVYYLIQTQNVTGGVNPIVTVTPRYEKVEANLNLKINPFVSDLEDVTLNIEAEFSDFIPPTVEGAPPGNATRKFISKIRIKNEEMIVIGGLEEAGSSETGSGVPVLSRIPIIRWLFSSRSKQNTNNKLLVFLKPTIVY